MKHKIALVMGAGAGTGRATALAFSNEGAKWDGGVFTFHLLKGLNGDANRDNNEWVTISELDRYLASEVAADTEGKQSPKMNGNLPENTPIAHLATE